MSLILDQNMLPSASDISPAPGVSSVLPNTKQVLFIDSRVQDQASLLKDLAPDTVVVQLDAQQDGLQQMADYVAGHQFDSVQIIAHGDEGQLWLGRTFLDNDNLQSHTAQLAQIGQGLHAGSDILIYSCNLAANQTGKTFIDSLARLTGADIAASDDRTGLGGDWQLEISTGSIEAPALLTGQTLENYQHALATLTVTSNQDNAAGSLRKLVDSAKSGDTIEFASDMSLQLEYGPIQIEKSLTIKGDRDGNGTPDIEINGGNAYNLMKINASNVKIDGVKFLNGVGAGHGGDYNFRDGETGFGGIFVQSGSLTLSHSILSGNAASGGGGNGGIRWDRTGAFGYGGGGGGSGSKFKGNDGARGGFFKAGDSPPFSTIPGVGGTGGFNPAADPNGDSKAGKGGGGLFGGSGGQSIDKAYSGGGSGGFAGQSSIGFIGGGGGASTAAENVLGVGSGGGAGGAMYIAAGATVYLSTTTISNNIAAGGGGAGGTDIDANFKAGDGGSAAGGILNKGNLYYNSATLTLSQNFGAGGQSGGSFFPAGGGVNGQGTNTGTEHIINLGSGKADSNWAPPPTTTVSSASLSADTGSSNTDWLTKTAAQTITGTLSAALAAGEKVQVSYDGGNSWSDASSYTVGSSNWSTTTTLAGSNTFQARVSSSGGNGTVYSHSYTLDQSAPATTVATLAFSADTGSPTDFITKTAAQTISGTLSADLGSDEMVMVSLDNGASWAQATANSGQKNFSLAGQNLSGANTLQLKVVDLAGNDAPIKSQAYVIDTIAPTTNVATLALSDDSGSSASDFITKTAAQTISGTLSAKLQSDETVLVSLDNGTSWSSANTSVGSNTFSLAGQSLSPSGTLKVKVTDLAGNDGVIASQAYIVDNTAPDVSSVTISKSTLGAGNANTATVSVSITEKVSNFSNANVTLTSGTVNTFSSSDGGKTWSATFTPTDGIENLTNVITVDKSTLTDLAGNAGSGSKSSANYQVDTKRPTVAITMSDTTLKIGETSLVTFTFSEVISGLTEGDLTVQNGTVSSLNSADGGITWKGTFTPSASIESSTNQFSFNNAGVVDMRGNSGRGFTLSPNYVIDTKAPTVAVAMSDSKLSIGETSKVTFTFSEAVTGFSLANVTAQNGTITSLTTSDNIVYSATFTPDTNLEATGNVITVDNNGVLDKVGNVGSGSVNSSTYQIDTHRPTATLSLSNKALKAGETATLTVTFSEAVTGFDGNDLTIANGSIGGLKSADGGFTWTTTYTPTAEVDASINVITLDNTGVADAFGNTGAASTDSPIFSLAGKRPTVSISLDDTDLRVAETANVTFTFSEVVTGFDNSDLTIDNGTLTGVSSKDGGLTYTAKFTPTDKISAPTNAISVAMTGVLDASGNTGLGVTKSPNYSIDTTNTAPTLSGSKAGQTTLDTATLTPFANVTVTDPDVGASETLSVKLDTAAKGTFTAASLTATGFSTSDGGLTYTHAADTPAAIQAALRGLVFQPATGRVAVGASETTTFTLSVNDGIAAAVTDSVTTVISSASNLAPTGINLSANQLDQSARANTLVGVLSSLDPNPGERFSYQLVAGNGSNDKDNAWFSVQGNQLLALNPNAMATGEYQILLRSTDALGLSVTQSLRIQVGDSALPSITGIWLADPATVNRSEVNFIVQFTKSVSGVDASDFVVATTGSASGTISEVSPGPGNSWLVRVSQVSGDGTLGLNLKFAETGIVDRYHQTLVNNGMVGQRYRIDPNSPEASPESDMDRDGIVRAIELAVPNLLGQGRGDGNGDGVADATQAHVSSLRWPASSEPAAYLSLSNQQQVAQSQVSTAPLPATDQSELRFDYGMLQAQGSGISRAGTLDFTLYSETLSAVNGLWLRDSAGHWNKVTAQIGSVAGRLKIDFSLQDGGQFDLDGLSNGSLNFQAALGYTKALVGKPGDADGDGIPDVLESANGTNPLLKDNAVHLRSDLFVKQLYRDVLYREADSAGLTYWQTQLDSGAINRQQMATSFMQQAEFQEIGSLARLYFGTFSRLPDREGLAYWIGQQKNGMALKNIAGSFVASSEFQSKFGNLDNSQFIDQVYQSVLQRSADAAGKSYWLTSLNAGASRGDVLMSFTESAEFKQVSQAKVSVTLDYLGLMGQVPDAASLAQLLQQNLSQPEIIGKLLDNPDYLARFM